MGRDGARTFSHGAIGLKKKFTVQQAAGLKGRNPSPYLQGTEIQLPVRPNVGKKKKKAEKRVGGAVGLRE